MPDFPVELVLGKGLPTDESQRLDDHNMSTIVTNLRCGVLGYRQIEVISNSITGATKADNWPYPQLIKGDNVTLLLEDTKLYTIVGTTATQITTSDLDDFSTANAIKTSNKHYHVATFQDFYYITDGVNQIIKVPDPDLGATEAICVNVDDINSTNVKVETCEMFGSTLILGGVSGSHLGGGSSLWGVLFDWWKSTAPDNIVTEVGQGIGVSWIIWSLPGDVDYPYHALMQIVAFSNATTDTKYTKSYEAIRDMIKKGFIGMMPVRGTTIKGLRSVGDGVIVYTDDYVGKLVPVSSGGFSYTDLYSLGVYERGAFDRNYFIDIRGDILFIDGNNVTKVGHQSQISALTANLTSLVYNPSEREYYISDGATSYMLNQVGLSKMSQEVTSVVDGNVGFVSTTNSTDFVWESGVLTFGFGGQKIISWLELHGQELADTSGGSTSHPILTLDYRIDKTSSFVTKPTSGETPNYIAGSPDLTYFIGVRAAEFRIKLQGSIDTNGKMERIIARVQYDDSISVHGPRGTGLSSLQAAEN